jgi:2-octaprenyl-6-methoxyphenol hydroxylase
MSIAKLHAVAVRAPGGPAPAPASCGAAARGGEAHAARPAGARAPIAILGGGPIGMVCALLLAGRGLPCVLVDARPLEALQRDRRLLALSRGTLGVLESLLGEGFAAQVPRAAIARVLVSSRGDLGSVALGAADFGGVPVGATVWYADLVGALGRAIEQHAAAPSALVRVLRPRRAQRVAQQPDRVQVLLDDGSALEAPLVIDAEGTPAQPLAARSSALLGAVEVLGMRTGDAIERFTALGPLALLPVPGAAHTAPGATRMSMIWCLPTGLAQQRLHEPAHLLLAQLAAALGPRIGIPVSIDARGLYPLATHRLDEVCEHRLVHLGNAAQTLHPVAGQGFNLGIRDCTCLVDCIAEGGESSHRAPAPTAGSLWDPTDPLLALQRYRRRRRVDRALVPGLTALLPRVFGSTLAPVVAGRSAALIALDTLPGLRRRFTRLLMYGS